MILSYDTLLTFSREVDYIWTRKMSVASMIFTLQRYSRLAAGVIAVLLGASSTNLEVRVVSSNEWQVLTLTTRCTVVSIMKLYVFPCSHRPCELYLSCKASVIVGYILSVLSMIGAACASLSL